MRGPALVLLSLLLAILVGGCGAGKVTSPTPETVEGTIPRETAPDLTKGDANAGKQIFMETASPACSTCHTFKAAGSDATTGPDLDEALQGDDAEHIYEQIVNPNSEITEGFKEGVMPDTYDTELSDKQLADLVAFLRPKS